jgi:ABC-2 type transport system ATP-binding protein
MSFFDKDNIAIFTKDLVKIYKGGTIALNGVNLAVEYGKSFALLGPNGAGKTTLIRILTTQLPITSGIAFVNGYDVSKEGSKVRKVIGYVPQEISVWTDLTGYENLLIYSKIYGIPSSERSNRINEVLEKMGLYEVRNDLVRTYSGGMIRRLEIACALLTRPKILFLDEPTIGLDPLARKIVWEELRHFKDEYEMTVFFTTHYMDEADLYSDEIALINKGKIIKVGSAEELKRSINEEVIYFEVEEQDRSLIELEVKKINGVREVIYNNSEVNVVVENADITLMSILDLLRTRNIKFKRIGIRRTTLDDVFIKYVGKSVDIRGSVSEVKHIRSRIRRG